MVAIARRKSRHRASRGVLRSFTVVGDYVLDAGVTRRGRHRMLVSAWTGPWRGVNDNRDYLHVVQNKVTRESREDVHVARTWFYRESKLRKTSRLQDVFSIWRINRNAIFKGFRIIRGLRQGMYTPYWWSGKV